MTALLHDFDYEIHPTLDQHPQDGAPILREEGYPEVVIEAVLSHAEHLAMPRDTPLKKTLFACDELSGFVHACGLVRPTGLDGLEPKSVRKKLKQPSFAAGVHRDEVYAGAELLGLELDEHIANVVEALQPIAPELGLRTAADAPRTLGGSSAARRGSRLAARPAGLARRHRRLGRRLRRTGSPVTAAVSAGGSGGSGRRGLDRSARRGERRGALRLLEARQPRLLLGGSARAAPAEAAPGRPARPARVREQLPVEHPLLVGPRPQRRRQRAAHEAAADEDVVHARPGGRVAVVEARRHVLHRRRHDELEVEVARDDDRLLGLRLRGR